MKQNGNMDRTDNMSEAAKRQALLEKLLKKKLPGDFKTQTIPKRKIFSPVPLSFSQQRLWVLDRLAPGNTSYNVPMALRLKGKIHIPVFEWALNEMIRRHESLRTLFTMENETPVQVILTEFHLRVNVMDYSKLPAAEKEQEAHRFMMEEAAMSFDLEHGPLVRIFLQVLDVDANILIYSMHHIISDTWSNELFCKELVAIYEAFLAGNPSPLPEPTLQYPDFAVWQREWFQGDLLGKQLSYWKNVLGGELPILEMPSDRRRPPVSSYRGRTFRIEIPESMTVRLMELTRFEGCSMFMMMLAVFNLLLYRYCGQHDILVGTPIANRKKQELEEIIGFFANTLVLRNDLSGNPTFRQFLERVRNVSAGAYDNQDLPFEKLVEELQPGRYMNYNPLFQAMLVLQNVPREDLDMKSKNLEVKFLDSFSGSVKFDIWISLTQFDKYFTGDIEYSTDLFDEDTILRFWAHFQGLLEVVVGDPGQHIDDLQFLSADQKEQLLYRWNDAAREYDIKPLHQAFTAQAAKTPDHVGLVGEVGPVGPVRPVGLTYRQLNEQSDCLAQLLIEKGVLADDVVAIIMERSVEMVIGLLGILKSGGAYLPIDPQLPQDRIDYMLKDSSAKLVVNEKFFRGSVPAGAVFQKSPPCRRRHFHHSSFIIHHSNLSYLIYTSGSTGKPKGVMVPHEGISNRLQWMQETYHLTTDDRVLQKTPYSFDVSVWEFFWTLLNGALLVMARPGGHKDSAYLVEVINRERITTIHFVPTMLNVFLEDPGVHTLRTLKRVICSGEALPAEYVEKFYELFPLGVELHNLYGPTEASVDVTYWPCEKDSRRHVIPIGKPVANTQVYILDRNSNIVPVGVHGELHIGGIQLARGYINRPELTAEKFCLIKSFSGGAGGRFFKKAPLLYRTGDLARWLPGGVIEFIGRIDHQVKVRGFRIELGEIESNLREHGAVSDAVVLAREGKLVAYIVPDMQAHAAAGDLSGEQVSDWRKVFDETYDKDHGQQDPTFNISGWNSSYTGGPIPAEEMQTWVDRTVERILSLKPQNIMEIGCGTGLFLFRVIPHCRTYLGTDISGAGLQYIDKQLEQIKQRQTGLAEVLTRRCSADDFTTIESGSLDLVILNSVVQYFPSADYLVEVLEKAVHKIKPGGHIFIGDVRGLSHLKTFHISVELSRAEPGVDKETILRRVIDRMSREQELVIDPLFFSALEKQVPRIKRAQLLIKYGRYANELSKFRYDVILHVGEENREFPRLQPDLVIDWKQEKPGFAELRQVLTGLAKEGHEPRGIVIKSAPNARLIDDTRAQKRLAGVEEPAVAGLYPDDFLELGKEFPYHIVVQVSPAPGEEGAFDVVFTHRNLGETVSAASWEIHPGLMPADALDVGAFHWHAYTNNPLLVKITGRLIPQLREYLKERVPEYMIPSHFIMLDRLPVTSSGKLHRLALPEPLQVQVDPGQEFAAPVTETELLLAQIWKEILNLEKVSINHNFFQLGGDSVNAIQTVSRANKKGLKISVQLIFKNQTIADLAAAAEKNRQKFITVGEDAYKEFAASLDMDAIKKQLAPGVEIEDIYPATPLQRHQAHFLETGKIQDPPLYLYLRWAPPHAIPIDIDLLKKILRMVSEHHRVLRTVILWKGLKEPLQVILKELEFNFAYYDLATLPPEEKLPAFNEALKQDWDKTFVRTDSSPMRVGVFKLTENIFQYYFTGDYMRVDGWSAHSFMEGIFALYGAMVTGAPIPALWTHDNCYKEYLHFLRLQDKNAARDYWRTIFKNYDVPKPLTSLPGNKTGQGTGFSGSYFYLTPEMTARLEQFLLKNRVSLGIFAQGLWVALLGQYLQRDRIPYGMVTTGRSAPLAGIEHMSGHSINIVPVSVPLSREKQFLDHLRDILDIQVEWTQYEYTQIDKIYEWLDRPVDRPLIDHYVVIQNLGSAMGEIRGMEKDAERWERDAELMFAKMEYPMRFDVFSGYEYCFTFQYYLRYYTTPAVKGLMDNLKIMIEAAIENPAQTVGELMNLVDIERYKYHENEEPDHFVQH